MHTLQGRVQPPHILSSCYNVYKQLLQKDVQNLEKQERKNSFQVISSVAHTQKSELRNVQYMNSALVTCDNLDPRGEALPLLKICLHPCCINQCCFSIGFVLLF